MHLHIWWVSLLPRSPLHVGLWSCRVAFPNAWFMHLNNRHQQSRVHVYRISPSGCFRVYTTFVTCWFGPVWCKIIIQQDRLPFACKCNAPAAPTTAPYTAKLPIPYCTNLWRLDGGTWVGAHSALVCRKQTTNKSMKKENNCNSQTES